MNKFYGRAALRCKQIAAASLAKLRSTTRCSRETLVLIPDRKFGTIWYSGDRVGIQIVTV